MRWSPCWESILDKISADWVHPQPVLPPEIQNLLDLYSLHACAVEGTTGMQYWRVMRNSTGLTGISSVVGDRVLIFSGANERPFDTQVWINEITAWMRKS